MVKVRFSKTGKDDRIVEASEGDTLMQTALSNGIDEILADCGGALSCATCHVHVAPDWMDRVGPPGDEEAAMLEMAVDPDGTSRLSCQIVMRADLDGLEITLPKSQL
ncbi:2Fe-2S iron-sulfur cluster-binding protein [Rhizorhabdus histidinilytica]|uniref:Ferredoxin, 2Fe-2S n=1 Tax=Rhizorhabdus histidinilytica TaxID=439228 RepID=A0A1T5EQZ4_9SPHN|nr:2Fe-2S iron-sulfur cluster-binding protein [Rhizorhabdus histidinilytica]SKB86367.1 ferredoxin, 2Fe-2S [Rhizorhabdus histidinilytica]